jgi:hypothetical protein
VFEEYTTELQRSTVRLLWAKGLNEMDIHKEMFPVYGVRFTAASRNMTKVSLLTKWLRQQSKDFYAAGFNALVKQCGWRICREINVFFSSSNITCVTFYIRL